MGAPTGTWIAYHEACAPQDGVFPVVDAIFSAELQASRHALAATTPDRIVKVVPVPFGVSITEAIAAAHASTKKVAGPGPETEAPKSPTRRDAPPATKP